MAENAAADLSQMNQETALAQAALQDGQPQGHMDTQADHHHEEKDANVKAIALIGAGMGAMGIGLFAGLWLLLNLFKRIPATPDAHISPLALDPPMPLAPRIQDANAPNYLQFLRFEEATLHSSGSVPLEENAWQREAGTMAGSRGTVAVPNSTASKTATNLYNPGPGVLGPEGAQQPQQSVRISLEQAQAALLQRGFHTRPQTKPPFLQQGAAGAGKPESLPLGMQPTGTYRADVGPSGKNP